MMNIFISFACLALANICIPVSIAYTFSKDFVECFNLNVIKKKPAKTI